MTDRYESLLLATEDLDPLPMRQDRRRLLTLGSVWLVLGALVGVTALAANSFTLAAIGAIGLICAVATIRGALRSSDDATVFALILPGSLQTVVAVLMVVYCATATAGSALMLAALFLGEGLIRIGVSRDERFPARRGLLINGLLALGLGAITFSQWPQPSLWVMGLSLGIDMACTGLSCLVLASALQYPQ